MVLEDMYASLNVVFFSKALEQYGGLLADGTVIEVTGKLNFVENKGPELICNEVSRPQELPKNGAQPQKHVRPGLYLRFPSQEDPRYEGGVTDLYLKFDDTGKVLRAAPKNRVEINRPLIQALEKLLGEGNVVYYGPKG